MEGWAELSPNQKKHFFRTYQRAKAAGIPFQEFLQLDRSARIRVSLEGRGPSIWTEERIAWLRSCYENQVPAAIIAQDLGISTLSVSSIAARFGIKRSDYKQQKHTQIIFSYGAQAISHQGNGAKRFYVYAYLRTDGTPHYIGKGTGRRAWQPHTRPGPRGGVVDRTPRDPNRIRLLAVGLTNQESLEMERDLISLLGRIEEGGCLYNFSDGGESPNHSAASRRRMSRHAKARGTPRSTIEAAVLKRKLRHAQRLGIEPDAYLAMPGKEQRHMNSWLRYNDWATIADYQAAFAQGSEARRRDVNAAANESSEIRSAERYGIPLIAYKAMGTNERSRVKAWLKADPTRTYSNYLNEKQRGRNSSEVAAHYGIPLDEYLQMPDQVRRRTKKWLRDNPGKTYQEYISRR